MIKPLTKGPQLAIFTPGNNHSYLHRKHEISPYMTQTDSSIMDLPDRRSISQLMSPTNAGNFMVKSP